MYNFVIGFTNSNIFKSQPVHKTNYIPEFKRYFNIEISFNQQLIRWHIYLTMRIDEI